MASTRYNQSVSQMLLDNAGEAWLADSFDVAPVVSPAAHDDMWLCGAGNHDFTWSQAEGDAHCSSATCDEVASHVDFVWQPVSFDFDSVVGFSHVQTKPHKAHQELLWQSIDGLEVSNLSRLVRIVRDWNVDSVEDPQSLQADFVERVDLAEPFELVEPAEAIPTDGTFFTLLHQSKHELLEREAGKDLWTWFCDWRDVVLSLVERFKTLSGEEVFDLLKHALAVRRSVPRVRPPGQRQALAERLLRLAESITPNAPPLPSRSEALPIGAG